VNVLFVCTENVARSRAAEALFHELQGAPGSTRCDPSRPLRTRPDGSRRATCCGRVIAVMETRHLDLIRRHRPHLADKVVVLEIRDSSSPTRSN